MKDNIFHIARITLQTETALSIATGRADGVFDTTLVVDANGLPTIPGSSIAGVLRHLYRDEHGETAMQQVFGYQNREKAEDSQPSRLQVSWGYIQDSHGKAVQGLLMNEARRSTIENDKILNVASALADVPLIRDRVRVNHKGVAADKGKFDRAILPAGHRFSVEFSLWSDERDGEQWNNVLNLLKHPLFRLGGATRAGLGKLEVVAVRECITDLEEEDERKTFRTLNRDLNDMADFKSRDLPEWSTGKVVTATISLTPNSYWRIGQGEPGDHNNRDAKGKNADLLPKFEQRVCWSNGEAEPGVEKLLIPGSSIKGALSHRIAFHANRQAGIWAEDYLKRDENDKQDDFDKSEHCETVQQLFGFARDEERKGNIKGQAGNLLIDDAYKTFSANDLQIIMHNSIDRFSGSVRDHMLFSEEMAWGQDIELQLTVRQAEYITPDAKKALQSALNDLCRGNLALGAGAAKGHGSFTGSITWSDGGNWIGGQSQ